MCSVGDDIEDIGIGGGCGHSPRVGHEKKNLSKCKKCSENSSLLLQKKDPFCKACFFEHCNHKYRSTIGKAKTIKHGHKILLACSGGRKSTAMLHMTKQTLEASTAKQISFTPEILFINDSLAGLEITSEQIHHVLNRLKSSRFSVIYTSLEMVANIHSSSEFFWSASVINSPEDFPTCEKAKYWLQESLGGMSLSAKLDYIKHLRSLLTSEIAHRCGHDYIFSGDTATSLAVDILVDINLGRGSQINLDTSFLDTRYKVAICRPLREFLNEEIAFYNHLHNCAYYVFPDLLTKTDSRLSIQRLTETFITNLQTDFPATVFTIFRTGSKLSMPDSFANIETCLICKSNLDNVLSDDCSAIEALSVSEKLSKPVDGNRATDIVTSLQSLELNSVSTNQIIGKEILNIFNYLCHGCSVMFRQTEVSNNYLLPFFTRPDVIKIGRHEMKKTIKSFLIEES